jgi:hypothetical protein
MTQISLPLFALHNPGPEAGAGMPVPDPTGFDAAGFEIGWDFAHHRLTPPADHLHGTHPVRQGWEAGRAAFGARTLKPTRHVRQWLELRLRAWVQGQPFEGVMLTPRYLAQIDSPHCPVTREALTGAAGAPDEAVVMRMDTRAAYAAGHLATVSRRVSQARGELDCEGVADVARRLRRGELAAAGGLSADQWERLACLLSLAMPLAHERVACLPLLVLPPNRLRLLNPVQALQALMTHLFMATSYARRMTALASLMPDADARRCYFLFMNAMLARRLAVGWSAERGRVRQALEEAWAHPVIQRRWEQLALRLRRTDCERIVRLAAQRGLLGGGWRWLDDDTATEGWQPAHRPQGPTQGAVVDATPGGDELATAIARRRRRHVPPVAPALQTLLSQRRAAPELTQPPRGAAAATPPPGGAHNLKP